MQTYINRIIFAPFSIGMPGIWTTYRSHIGETLRLAWPVIVGQLGQIMIGITDSIMVGQLPTEYGSAATLANSVFFLFTVIGIGISAAITPLVAQSRGEKNDALTGDLQKQGMWVGLFVGVFLWIILLGSVFIVPLLGQDPKVTKLAIDFLVILSFSVVPMMIFLVFKYFLDGLEIVLPGMLIIFLVLALNLFLNWIFINGHWGFPEMKLNGSGLASVLARCFGTLIIVCYVILSSKFKSFKISFVPGRLKKNVFNKILRMGLPSGLQYFFESGSFTVAVILAGLISVEAQKAHNVALQLAATTYMVYIGLSVAASIRVGNAFGARDFDRARKAGFAAILCGLIFIVFSILAFVFLRNWLPMPFVNGAEPAVYEIAVSLLLIAALFQVADGIQAIAQGALRGFNDVRLPMVFTFIAYWGIGIPSGIVLAFPIGLGIQGIWLGLSIGLAASAVFLILRYIRMSRVDRLYHARMED